MSPTRDAWLALNLLDWTGLGFLDRLVPGLSDPGMLLTASRDELAAIAQLAPHACDRLLAARARLDLAAHLEWVARLGLLVTTRADAGYPSLLATLPDAPMALYHRGPLPDEGRLAIAVVGTRAATHYGRQVTRTIASDLASAGVTIVSGLAQGIDGVAHEAALSAGGATVAVLATGADVCYPPGHRRLYERIWDVGTVVSEAPPGTQPRQYLFPRRNRIISGLCRGVLVVEAPERSGALLTAELAGAQGRDVFAVPGPVTSPQSRGTNRLLSEGAAVATGADVVLSEYGQGLLFRPPVAAGPALSEAELRLVEALGTGGAGLDEIAISTGFDLARTSILLLDLLDRGIIARLPGHRFAMREGSASLVGRRSASRRASTNRAGSARSSRTGHSREAS